MKKIISLISCIIMYVTVLCALLLTACDEHIPYKDRPIEEVYREFGWLADDEDPSGIPVDITPFSGDTAHLPPAVLFENRYPPIGDQGSTGTCVVWAIGYSLKSALNAIERNWTGSELTIPDNQISPAALWNLIPTADKDGNCRGTKFEAAMDALIAHGAQTAGDDQNARYLCGERAETGDPRNRIANYRRIAYNGLLKNGAGTPQGMTAANFKGYLSQGRPIVVGVKTGPRFTAWESSEVLEYETGGASGMHGQHAMVMSGYDDSKQAFRLRNSWGAQWGDEGSVWVGYEFFLNEFCYLALVAQNHADKPENVSPPSFSYDLIASFAKDTVDSAGTGPRDRIFTYDVYNVGAFPVLASQKWTVFYVYYNAYDANDIGIIYEDYYTDEFGQLGDDAEFDSPVSLAGGWWNHVNVAPGKRAGEAEWGAKGFTCEYTMPDITGDYYLVVIADAMDKIRESNEDNNHYYITADYGKPLKFVNGVMQSAASNPAAAPEALGKKTNARAAASVAQLGQSNAYTPYEINLAIAKHKRNGTLSKKRAEFRSNKKKAVR